MRHQNTVFHALLKHVPWRLFERLVDEYRADHRIRKLDTKTQLIALLYGQLSGSTSLREIEAGLASHRARLYHVGARAVARSTLADANAMRPVEVFAGLFKHLLGQVHGGLRRKTRDAVRLIDATGVRLSNLSAGWAMFSSGVCGAKLHVVLDPDADIPLYFAVTTAKVNDITAAKAMPIEPGATYVFDLGYYDFSWWAALDAQGCRLVTRLKSNTRVTMVHENDVQQGSNIISDRIGHLPERMAASRTNPFQDPIREINVVIEGGTVLRLVTNDLDAPAEEIAELYKRRWQVELFFRWVKQTLKIKHFLGTSENAVRIQIAVALIAFLLLRLAQAAQDSIQGALHFARLIRTNLMHRRPIDRLLTPALPPPRDDNQLSFSLPLA